MKKLVVWVIPLMLTFSYVLPSVAQSRSPKNVIEWKVLCAWPKGYVHREHYIVPFVNLVNERAKGELKLKIVGGPEVWPVFDQLAPIRDDVFQVDGTTPAYQLKDMAASNVPQTIAAPMDKVRASGLWDLMQKAYAKVNIHLIGAITTAAPLHVFTKKPVRKADDFKGLVIRDITGMFKRLGANCVSIAVPEVYTSFQEGVIDGIGSFPPDAFVQMKWYEQTKYIIYPGYGDLYLGLIANLDAWNALPDHLKNLVTEAAKDIERRQMPYFRRQYDKAIETLTKAGMEKIYLPKADGKKLLDAWFYTNFDQTVKRLPVLGPQMLKIGEQLRKYAVHE